MASTKEYLDFVLEQLSNLDEVNSRAMMGEYILYYRGRVFGGIYDDSLLVKPVPVAVKLMLDAELEMPHDGGRRCFWWMTLITGSSCAGWFGACGKNCRRRKGRIQRNHRFRGRGFQRRTASLLAHDFPGKV